MPPATPEPAAPAAPAAESSWVDLVDVPADARVLLVDGAGGRAVAALRRHSGHVVVVSPEGAGSLGSLGSSGLSSPERWDLVCLDKVETDSLPPETWRRLRRDQTQVVVVGDTTTSPVRLLDRVARRRDTPRTSWSAAGRARVVRRLGRTGLPVTQVFGLLRSGDAPAVAFDALAPSSLPAVLGATRAHVGGWRATALSAAARLPPAQALRLFPAWLVVAGGVDGAPPDRVVGKVSNRDSEEIKLVRGEPVSAVERRHLVGRTTGEVSALRELEGVGFDLAPRVLGEPTPYACRYSWLSGSSLALDRLDDDALVAWVGRAAAVLADLQRRTRHPDGTVLVHGDYWLGNLLTSSDAVTAVVDWTEATRGSDEVDREFLVTSLAEHVDSVALRARLERARDAHF